MRKYIMYGRRWGQVQSMMVIMVRRVRDAKCRNGSCLRLSLPRATRIFVVSSSSSRYTSAYAYGYRGLSIPALLTLLYMSDGLTTIQGYDS